MSLLLICCQSFAVEATEVISSDEISFDSSSNSYIITEPAFRDIVAAWKIAEESSAKYRDGMNEVVAHHEEFSEEVQVELELLKAENDKERTAREAQLAAMTKKANRRWGIGAFAGYGFTSAGSTPELVMGIGVYYRLF